MTQKVKLGRTMSGIPGFFTSGMLALRLGSDAVREIKANPAAATEWANRYHFEFAGYHSSWGLTQDTLNDVHTTIDGLANQYKSGLITPFELIRAVVGIKEDLGAIFYDDMTGLTCPNTGLIVSPRKSS